MNNIRSMTGYGKGESVCQGKKITVEIKSLNSKQLDLSVKIPSFFREREFRLREMVSQSAIRGKVDLFVSVEAIEKAANSLFNKEVFDNYFQQIKNLSTAVGINVDTQTVNTILRFPDVMQQEKQEVDDQLCECLDKATQAALQQLDEFRLQEGKRLIGDILERIDSIDKMKEDVAIYDPERIEGVRKRIYDNLESLGTAIDNNRFEQELIYYIEKLDITEEKVRLEHHLEYFREVCRTDQAPGRKLGFIAQEIGREINTTGSKANKSEIQRLVVAMKDELEKIKEQSLNIL